MPNYDIVAKKTKKVAKNSYKVVDEFIRKDKKSAPNDAGVFKVHCM